MSKLKRIHEKLEEMKGWLRERDHKIELYKADAMENQKTIAYWQEQANKLSANVQTLQEHLMKYEGTPANRRGDTGDEDPFIRYLDRERADLPLGKLTDDELANAIFMNYDVRPPIEDLLSGKGIMPIVYMTAGKERIRWLSRKLTEALGVNKATVSKDSSEIC